MSRLRDFRGFDSLYFYIILNTKLGYKHLTGVKLARTKLNKRLYKIKKSRIFI